MNLRRIARARAGEARPAPPHAGGAEFRPDLEALRGVAVLLVLAYHAGLPVDGGFIGVDVFFVLSGFLITGLLVRERERAGRIDLVAFYGRRVRRILPAAAVVVAATILVVPFVVSPLDMPRMAGDAVSSILAFSNIRFAATDLDYFADHGTPSPFRQFWSLAVEEQFYFVWPALLVAATWGRRPRLGAGIAVAGLFAASLAACVVVSGIAVPWAFYSLPTRAWQLAAGGLLAIALPLLPRVPSALVIAAGWVGAALLALAALTFGELQPYPGWYALVPTLATLALIASGELARSPGRVLQVAPLRFTGRISYSLYLWHWPVLILTALALGEALPVPLAVALLAGAYALSAWSYRYVEQPYRRPGRGVPVTAAFRPALATIVAVALLSVGTATYVTTASGLDASSQAAGPVGSPGPAGSPGPEDLAGLDAPPIRAPDGADLSAVAALLAGAQEPAKSPAVGSDRSPTPAAPSSTSPSVAPSASGSSSTRPDSMASAAPLPSPTPSYVAEIAAPKAASFARGAMPAKVRPSIAAARQDGDPLMKDGCAVDRAEREPKLCIYGREDAPHTVVLIGDSHASMWFGALRVLAEQRDWRLIPMTKNACTFIDAPVVDPNAGTVYTACAAWIDAVMKVVPELKPDLVVVSMNSWVLPAPGAPTTMKGQGQAIGRLLKALPHPVLLISATPFYRTNVPGCLAANRRNIDVCVADASWIHGYWMERERVAVKVGKATLVDMSPAICPRTPCSPIVDGIIVMKDEHHLTNTFSRHLAGPLGIVLDRLGISLRPEPMPMPTSSASPGSGPAR